ncbi:MAG: hypothetical protein PHN39_02120 [Candidatus Pacebacteria bacterium]|nr:hypothetical protein [Candidatus Paceibacterota bacterium]
MRRTIIFASLFLIVGVVGNGCGTVFAYTMTSPNYRMQLDSTNIGGERASSNNYFQEGTVGETATGFATASSFRLYAGFQQAYASSSSACDNNGICAGLENSMNCTSDCGCNNNLTCESQRGEDVSNCSTDCRSGSTIFVPDTVPLKITNVEVKDINFDSALISWSTDEVGLCKFTWGTTTNYYGGAISEEMFLKQHETLLFNLYSGSLYYFKIICRDTNNNWAETSDFQFSTLSISNEETLSNIETFSYQAGERNINLTWGNPKQGDWEEIQIFKSEKFYPQNPNDGELVFKGKEVSFHDINIKEGVDYYYTAFTVDKNGNYSSGAILKARVKKPGEREGGIPPAEEPKGKAPESIERISWLDFEFWQDGKRIEMTSGRFSFEKGLPIKIAIPYKKFPEVLKTVMVSLEKGQDYFSFLLKINKDQTHYIATIAPPEEGVYPLNIYILDYKNQTMKKLESLLEVKTKKTITSLVNLGFLEMGFLKSCKGSPCFLLILTPLIFIIAVLMLVIFSARRKTKKSRINRGFPLNAEFAYKK